MVLCSTLSGAILGIPAIALSAHIWGAPGAVFALALSQIVVCIVQAPVAVRVVRYLKLSATDVSRGSFDSRFEL